MCGGKRNLPAEGLNKKVWENEKKALTNGEWFGILPKLSAAANAAAVSMKKEFEKIQKVLDSMIEICYLNKVAVNDKWIAS